MCRAAIWTIENVQGKDVLAVSRTYGKTSHSRSEINSDVPCSRHGAEANPSVNMASVLPAEPKLNNKLIKSRSAELLQETVDSHGKVGPCTSDTRIPGLEHCGPGEDQFWTAASPQPPPVV